jgi:hypothetical protein
MRREVAERRVALERRAAAHVVRSPVADPRLGVGCELEHLLAPEDRRELVRGERVRRVRPRPREHPAEAAERVRERLVEHAAVPRRRPRQPRHLDVLSVGVDDQHLDAGGVQTGGDRTGDAVGAEDQHALARATGAAVRP